MGSQDLVIKPAKSFGVDFRKNLTGIDAVATLKQLNNENAVEEFISQGGDILDVVAVLQSTDLSDVHIVFSALTQIIARYVTVASAEDSTHCEEACHTILTIHASSIQKCFNQQKGCIFRLFAAMVQVSFHIAKTVLLSFDKCLIIDRKDNSSRKDYIDLVNAFLNDENIFIARTLLEKGVVNKVISGLMHDQSSSIITILSTITEKIVSNVGLNKSLKMQVFNTSALNFLYGLYYWKGSPDQCKLVRESVHALLIQLCTDYKKGIVYFDESYGTSGQKMNPLIFNFLRKINTPWMDELSADLVTKLLHSCPDLVKPIFESYKNSFEPRDSNNFYKLCSFLSNFIATFEIIDKLNNGKLLMNIIRHKFFPTTVMEIIKSGTDVNNKIQVRNVCYDLFVTILNKFEHISKAVKGKFPESSQKIFDFMQSELPDLPKLLKSWKTDSSNNRVECQVKLADVILTYCNVFSINFIPDRSVTFLDDNIISNPELYVKALQINAILFEPSIDNLDHQKGIEFILTHEVENFYEVFHTLLNSCHLFDGFQEELEVWYQTLNNVELSKREVVASAFILALKHMSGMMSCLESTEVVCSDLSSNLISNVENHMKFTPIPNMTTCLPSLLSQCHSQLDIESFINEVTVGLFHMQTCTKTFYSIIKKYLTLPKSKTSVVNYLKSWSKHTNVQSLPDKIIESNNLEIQLSQAIIQKDENSLHTLLSKFKSKKNKYKRLLNCTRMSLFYATQCAENNLDEQLVSLSIEAFIELSKIIPAHEKEIIIKEAFANPILTKDFSRDTMALSPLLSHLIKISQDGTHVISYRHILFPKLKQMLAEDCENFDSSALLNLITCLGLNREDAKEIVDLMLDKNASKFYKKKKLSFWGKLMKYLLGEVKPELNEPSINKMETLLCDLINAGVGTTSMEESLANLIIYCPYYIQYINISNLVDKISSHLTVTMISIQPDIVEHLPKPKLLINALPTVQAIQKYAPSIGKKYISRVLKLVEKNLLDMILSDEGIAEINEYLPELGYVLDNINAVAFIQKMCEHINSIENFTIHSNNCALLTLLYKKAQNPDDFFIKLVQLFATISPEQRVDSKWVHKALTSTVTESSAISFAPSSPWHDFIKICLKDSLSNENILSLDTLTTLCRVLPAEKCHHNIFKMIISHSKFVEIMLSESLLKNSLVIILNVFIKGGQVPLAPSHIPLFLSAYNATLSLTDQYLFEIIQRYEAKDVDMHEYKPFLWGSAAATYYSVSDSIMSKTLNRQPHPSQVTTLLLELFVKRTVTEFPQNRMLIPTDLNDNEPKKYDISFLLPLFIFLLSPESPVQLNKFIDSGALAITLASLSSNDPSIRKSAYMVLFRFQSHLAGVKNEKAGLVAHFIDVLRNGISPLIEENDEDASPQLSSIVSIFLARASLIVSNPSHQLYSTLHKYFLAKPALELRKVPEFLVLFQSENEYNREWILTIIRDGLNTLQDWILCDKTVIFKILFSFYTSTLCSRSIQTIIFEIINKCLSIEKGRFYLINSQGLLSWLKDIDYPLSVLETLSKHQKADPNGFLQTLLVHSLLHSKSREETQAILKCILEFIQGNSAENVSVLTSQVDAMMNVLEKQFGCDYIRDAKQMLKHSCVYVIPLDKMSDITKITFLLLSSK